MSFVILHHLSLPPVPFASLSLSVYLFLCVVLGVKPTVLWIWEIESCCVAKVSPKLTAALTLGPVLLLISSLSSLHLGLSFAPSTGN